MSRLHALSRFFLRSHLQQCHISTSSVPSDLIESLSPRTRSLYSSSSRNLAGRIGRVRYGISRVWHFHGLRAHPFRSFSSCSATQDLTMKRCVPCNSKDIQLMSEQMANEQIKQVQGWELLNEDGTMKLQRSWKVKSFIDGLKFFQLVADIAEAEGHHPDLHLVGWNNVKIEIWTHSVGGLTENDFILAAKISSLKAEHLLRNKTAAQSV